MKIKIFLITLMLAMQVSVPLWAEETKQLTVDALLQEALAHNPQVLAAKADWQAAQKRQPQASALPNPTAEYGYMGKMIETRNGPIKEQYAFEQDIPFPGKLVERRQVAKAEAVAAKAKLGAVTREVMYKVSEAYYDLVAVEKTIAAVEKIQNAIKEAEAVVQARYESNKVPQSDLVKVQMQSSQILQRLYVLRQQKDTGEALLKALLNRQADIHIAPVDVPLPKLPLTLEQVLAIAGVHRPELLEAEAMAQRSAHALILAKYENMPDFSIGLQYSRIGAGETSSANDGQDAWMIPIKVTLPIWQNRIGSAIEEARHDFDASQERLSDAQNTTAYAVKAAYYRFESLQKIVSVYENALMPQAQMVLHSAQAGYESGREDLLNYVDTRVNYLNIQAAYEQALADGFKALAALQQAVGKDLIGAAYDETTQ